MWLPGTDSEVFGLRMVITLFVLFQTNNVTGCVRKWLPSNTSEKSMKKILARLGVSDAC